MKNVPEIKSRISEITRRFLGEMTLEAFATSLGINANRQMVWNWKEGAQAPAVFTLFRVISSASSTPAAKAWAGECLSVFHSDGLVMETDLDKEIERRR